jgi:hypothetical protein
LAYGLAYFQRAPLLLGYAEHLYFKSKQELFKEEIVENLSSGFFNK